MTETEVTLLHSLEKQVRTTTITPDVQTTAVRNTKWCKLRATFDYTSGSYSNTTPIALTTITFPETWSNRVALLDSYYFCVSTTSTLYPYRFTFFKQNFGYVSGQVPSNEIHFQMTDPANFLGQAVRNTSWETWHSIGPNDGARRNIHFQRISIGVYRLNWNIPAFGHQGVYFTVPENCSVVVMFSHLYSYAISLTSPTEAIFSFVDPSEQ